MSFLSFGRVFPEIASRETRCITTSEEGPVPPDTYYFLDLYCIDTECDCRKAHFAVVTENWEKEYAHIQFGWEEKAYYDNHFSFEDHDLPGPSIPPFTFFPHGEYFVELFRVFCANDPDYVERLKRHCALMKQASKEQNLFEKMVLDMEEDSIGRNDPCICGSGKKYKKCCKGKVGLK